MKFLARLDPMTVLMLVVIFGVVITMSTQAVSKTSTTASAAQAVQVDVPADQVLAGRKIRQS